MAEAEPGAGNIAIELDGNALELVPTVDACIKISRLGGGLNAAVQRCLQLDFETICAVITAGLNLNPVQAKTVPEAVYKQGLMALSGPCIDFINVVANGGRPLEEEGGGEESEGPPVPASP